ncbi:MAG: polysaccharide biosynthesis protein [Deltaproteobacteria bacterium]|nr:polysaccharide biosynthesis protein [Deltaproteobacteria bacterium]
MTSVDGRNVLITGGTGSLGKVLVRRLLSGQHGTPNRITVLSRDEAKQHAMRVEYQNRRAATDDVVYRRFRDLLDFRIGDVRNECSVRDAVRGQHIVVNAAALKQVPTCEYFPYEAVLTNVGGAEHLSRAVREVGVDVDVVVGISTDKACEPVNVMGMTKALQERIFARANLQSEGTRFILVRYGNVLASRGSVLPLFREQILSGGPVTITDERMTRFLLSLDQAVDLVIAAVAAALPGETWIPRLPAARVVDVARAMIGERAIKLEKIGVRPGEKLHESLVSDEEGHRTRASGPHYVVAPLLPELRTPVHEGSVLGRPYTSNDELLDAAGVVALLERQRLRIEDTLTLDGEFLR